MNNKIKCVFCQTEKILKWLPLSKNDTSVPCDRGIYEDTYCVATLAPEQYSHGHTLVVLKNHRTDMADGAISNEELLGFVSAIHKVAKHLKEKLRDRNDKAPEKIYVCSLCDGVEHLHAHLVPRYKFTTEDDKTYKKLFKERDGEEQVAENITNGKMGGFWYVAERERNYKKSKFWNKSDEKRAHCLEELAKGLRLSQM